MSETTAKTVALADYQKTTKVTMVVTKLADHHNVRSSGYSEGDVVYSIIGPGVNESSHDLHGLKRQGPITDDMVSFLENAPFGDLHDGETYEVGE